MIYQGSADIEWVEELRELVKGVIINSMDNILDEVIADAYEAGYEDGVDSVDRDE